MAIVLTALREALIGGAEWHTLATPMIELLPLAVASVAVGVFFFRLFLRRERRLGHPRSVLMSTAARQPGRS